MSANYSQMVQKSVGKKVDRWGAGSGWERERERREKKKSDKANRIECLQLVTLKKVYGNYLYYSCNFSISLKLYQNKTLQIKDKNDLYQYTSFLHVFYFVFFYF